MAPTITNYNLSRVTEASGNKFVALAQYSSEATNYFVGLFLLIIPFVIISLVLKSRGHPTTHIFAAASLVNFLLAVLLYPLQIITGTMLVVSIVLLPVSIVMLYFS